MFIAGFIDGMIAGVIITIFGIQIFMCWLTW